MGVAAAGCIAVPAHAWGWRETKVLPGLSSSRPAASGIAAIGRSALEHTWDWRKILLPSTTFTVVNTNDSGAGSLGQAILDANANAGADTISFNIPSSDPNCSATTHVCTIRPASELPHITDPVIIDGYTQPGTSRNTLSDGDNTNYHSLTNSRFIITAAASDSYGHIASFSTPSVASPSPK